MAAKRKSTAVALPCEMIFTRREEAQACAAHLRPYATVAVDPHEGRWQVSAFPRGGEDSWEEGYVIGVLFGWRMGAEGGR